MTDFFKFSFILGASALALTACGKAEAPKAETKSEPAKKASSAASGDLCVTMGPQTPRDIASKAGLNTTTFAVAPASTKMNLCNIHTHTNAEHKGPGFSVFVNDSDHGGYACNDSGKLTADELAPYAGSDFGYVKPGNTIGSIGYTHHVMQRPVKVLVPVSPKAVKVPLCGLRHKSSLS